MTEKEKQQLCRLDSTMEIIESLFFQAVGSEHIEHAEHYYQEAGRHFFKLKRDWKEITGGKI